MSRIDAAVTARLVRKLGGWQGDARLFKLSRPVSYGHWEEQYHPTRETDYVVVQAHVVKLLGVPGPETYIYPADANGTVLDWEELPGSLRGSLDHEEALRNAGWEVVDAIPIRGAVTEARRRHGDDYYVIDVGTDAVDSATRRDAVQLARAAVKGGRDWSGPTVNIAIVYLSGEGREYVYALWRNPDGSFDESRDPPEVESKWQEMLAPYRGRPSAPIEESRPSRGMLWTIDYRAVWPDGRGLWRVAVVRAMSAPEALAKLRRREQGVELTEVTIEPGHNVPGYESSHIIEEEEVTAQGKRSCAPDTGAGAYRDWYEQSSDELADYVAEVNGLGGLSDAHTRLNLLPEMFEWRFCELRTSELLRIMPAVEWRRWYEYERGMRRDEDGDDNYFDSLEQEWGTTPSPIGPIVVVYLDRAIDVGDGWHRSAIAVTQGWKTVPAVIGTKLRGG